MRWIRRNRHWGGRLALFALAVQIVLSFGHVHAANRGLAAPGAVASQAQGSTGEGGVPSSQDRGDAHDICAICATLSLASTSLLPTVVALTLPVAHDWDWLVDPPSTQVAFDLALYFQARAPPHA